jgi:hypothetical protein
MKTVAVSALHDDEVCRRESMGVKKYRRAILAEIAAEHDATIQTRLAAFKLDAARAQDMSGVAQPKGNAGQQRICGVVPKYANEFKRALHVVGGEKRLFSSIGRF